MTTATYDVRRTELETYFDRTAADAWSKLTSDAKVSRIRATVRAGRDQMRATLLDYLPADLSGRRILDAGCGTGALAVEAARRGADVVAIDISPTLIALARERSPADLGAGRIAFEVGDMLDAGLGNFDHVVAMDSLIHYRAADVVRVLGAIGARTSRSMVFTFAPGSPVLAAFRGVGKLFPRGDRSPMIELLGETSFRRALQRDPALGGWGIGRTQRVSRGFYTSQAQELLRA